MSEQARRIATDLAAVDAAIAELNDRYWRDGYVLVRERKVGVYWREKDGQPTGRPLIRFDATLVPGLEDAEEWLWDRHLASQEEDGHE